MKYGSENREIMGHSEKKKNVVSCSDANHQGQTKLLTNKGRANSQTEKIWQSDIKDINKSRYKKVGSG